MPDINFSQEIIDATEVAHISSINTPIMQAYLDRKTNIASHADYILQQYWIFLRLEKMVGIYREHPIFLDSGLYEFVVGMQRSAALKSDYIALVKASSRDDVPDMSGLWPETRQLIDEMNQIAHDPALVLAHVFVHYLALLNGGMIIKLRLTGLLKDKDAEEPCLKFYTHTTSFFSLNDQFQKKVNTISKHLNKDKFLQEVKKSYHAIIAQMYHGHQSTRSQFSACGSTLFKALPYIAAGAATVAFTAAVLRATSL